MDGNEQSNQIAARERQCLADELPIVALDLHVQPPRELNPQRGKLVHQRLTLRAALICLVELEVRVLKCIRMRHSALPWPAP